MVAIAKDAAGTTFEDLRQFIEYEAFRFSQKYRVDREELVSHANFIFVRAWNTYNPSSGKFKTWLRYLLGKIWLEHVRRAAQRQARLPRVGVELTRTAAPEKEDAERWLDDLLDELSDDARLVVQLTVDTPKELAALARYNTPKSMRSALHQFLRMLGWSGDRIAESFEEIAGAL